MRLILFGTEIPPALADELTRGGLELESAPEPRPEGDGAVAELAAGLRGAEAALAGDQVACALVAGSGDAALAAALAAVKLEIPTAWLAPADPSEVARLIGRVADLTLDASQDAATSAPSIRELAAPRLHSP